MILKFYKKLFWLSIVKKGFQNLSVGRIIDLLNETLKKIIRSYNPNQNINLTIVNLHQWMKK